MRDTIEQYEKIFKACEVVFQKKTSDYGTSWRILRPSALTDQIYIKAKRIRTIQIEGISKVGDGVEGEFMAIVNYGILALVQLEMEDDKNLDLTPKEAHAIYLKHKEDVKNLMIAKNHDYGEAWRDMRISSMTDLILTKILRIKKIEDNNQKTIISEGVEGNYMDIINYALFCLILIDENLKI